MEPTNASQFMVNDPVWSEDELTQTIVQRAAARPKADLPTPKQYGVSRAVVPTDRTAAEIAHQINTLNQAILEFETEPVLASSAATSTPILGPLWERIRRPLHQLILFYTNRAVTQQVDVNRRLIDLLQQLLEENQALKQRIETLEERHIE